MYICIYVPAKPQKHLLLSIIKKPFFHYPWPGNVVRDVFYRNPENGNVSIYIYVSIIMLLTMIFTLKYKHKSMDQL